MIRENILRQVIFTNRNIFYASCLLLTYCFWRLLGEAPTDIKVFVSVVICGCLLLLTSIRIDRQPLIFLLGRYAIYLVSKKKERF
jgi:hypothetical protein